MKPLSSYIERVLPGWMRRRAMAHWSLLALTTAALFDALVEAVDDGTRADMPGQEDDGPGMFAFQSTDAQPYIARDRRMFLPLSPITAATVAANAAHLRDWYSVHRRSATGPGMLNEVAAILSPNPPRLRLVNPNGTWWTREPDGTLTLQNHQADGFSISPAGVVTTDFTFSPPWDWDSVSIPAPPDQNDAGRCWLIIYAPCNLPFLKGTEGKWGDGKSKFGDVDGVMGTLATSPHVELRRAVANEFRSAGVKLSHIIIAYDAASFDPAFAAGHAGMPDGHWGNHSKLNTIFGGRRVRVLARNQTARYGRGHAGTDY